MTSDDLQDEAPRNRTPLVLSTLGVLAMGLGIWTFKAEPVGASVMVFSGFLSFFLSYHVASFRPGEVFAR